MKYKTILMILTVVVTVVAQGITPSKDTCLTKIPAGSTTTYDTITLTNSGPDPVVLDSAMIEFEGLDTARFMNEPPYLRMTEIIKADKWNILFWELDSLGESKFRCSINTTYGASEEALSIGPSGDSIKVAYVLVGTCAMCAAIHPLPFSHGILRMYYSNGQIIELHLLYDDPKVPIRRFGNPLYHHGMKTNTGGMFLINGRCVPQQLVIRNRLGIRHIILTKRPR